MAVPKLDANDIESAIPGVKVVGPPVPGGQKLVFPCEMDGERFALKTMLTNPTSSTPGGDDVDDLDEVSARARREVETMREVDSPHLVKLGPMPLSLATIAKQEIVYFTEEWIEGRSVRALLDASGPLSIADTVQLGLHATEAVKLLWELAKIHRDVKPQNIMRRSASGEFVLLDLGLVFDLSEDSLTMFGMVAGTPFYFSPEQTEFTRKRQLDFRSDLFALGIVLYEAASGVHPFWLPNLSVQEVVGRILTTNPVAPSSVRLDIPPQLDTVIMRLLGKQPHLRYGSCDQLSAALATVPT